MVDPDRIGAMAEFDATEGGGGTYFAEADQVPALLAQLAESGWSSAEKTLTSTWGESERRREREKRRWAGGSMGGSGLRWVPLFLHNG